MPAWTLWLLLAALLVLPVVAVLVEDGPPRNEITHEQDPGDGRPDDDERDPAACSQRHNGLVSLETILATLLDPHPELVAAQKPTPAEVFEAARYLGWMPAEPFLVPAVPADRGGV